MPARRGARFREGSFENIVAFFIFLHTLQLIINDIAENIVALTSHCFARIFLGPGLGLQLVIVTGYVGTVRYECHMCVRCFTITINKI